VPYNGEENLTFELAPPNGAPAPYVPETIDPVIGIASWITDFTVVISLFKNVFEEIIIFSYF
tara:strand:+ start:12 stop:197 length:186 start_codon:yes stop_codon:yes gene_type:complete